MTNKDFDSLIAKVDALGVYIKELKEDRDRWRDAYYASSKRTDEAIEIAKKILKYSN